MALVYAAVDADGAPVALKVMEETVFLPPTVIARFRREAEAAKRLRRHPHIVTVYDTGHMGRSHFIAMELVPGGQTLEKVLAASPLPLQEALKIGVAIAQALSYAHDQGIIHRDLKPGNILMTDFHEPLLADFGLARMEFEDSHNLTISSMSMGTPRYMAPEQTISARRTGVLTDVYSFGVLLFELLTARPPYDIPPQVSMVEMFEVIRHSRPRDPRKLRPDIPRDIAAVLQKLLEKDPKDRYQSMRTVLQDLEAHLAGKRVSVRVPNIFERCDRIIRRHKLAALSITTGSTLLFTVWQRYERKLGGQWEEQAVERAQLNSQNARLEELLGKAPLGERANKDEHLLAEAWEALTVHHDVSRAEAMLLDLERRVSAPAEAPLPEGVDYPDAMQLASQYRHLSDLRAAVAQREVGRLALARGDYLAARGIFRSLGERRELPTAHRRLSTFEAGVAVWLEGDREEARKIWRGVVFALAREAFVSAPAEDETVINRLLEDFMDALADQLPNGETNVTDIWKQTLEKASTTKARSLDLKGESPFRDLEHGIGLLCLGGLGWIPPRELVEMAKRNPSIIRSLGFWLAAQQVQDKADRLRLTEKAKMTAKEALPWLYYILDTAEADRPTARQTSSPAPKAATER